MNYCHWHRSQLKFKVGASKTAQHAPHSCPMSLTQAVQRSIVLKT